MARCTLAMRKGKASSSPTNRPTDRSSSVYEHAHTHIHIHSEDTEGHCSAYPVHVHTRVYIYWMKRRVLCRLNEGIWILTTTIHTHDRYKIPVKYFAPMYQVSRNQSQRKRTRRRRNENWTRGTIVVGTTACGKLNRDKCVLLLFHTYFYELWTKLSLAINTR